MTFYLFLLFLHRIILITSMLISSTTIESKNTVQNTIPSQRSTLPIHSSPISGTEHYTTTTTSSSTINNNHIGSSNNHQIPSSPFTSNTIRSLPAVKVDPKGAVYTTEILKQQLADELKLPLRDLRIVDPSFPNQIQATFTARPNVILFTLENIKVVIKHNEALVFNPFQQEVQEFVPALQQQIAKDKDRYPTTTRFEHIVIEAALNVVCNNLFRRLRALSPAITSALNELRAESKGLDIIQTQVDELLPLKNKLDELRKRVKEIDRAIKAILDNDEDLDMMYLSSSSSDQGSNGLNNLMTYNTTTATMTTTSAALDIASTSSTSSNDDPQNEITSSAMTSISTATTATAVSMPMKAQSPSTQPQPSRTAAVADMDSDSVLASEQYYDYSKSSSSSSSSRSSISENNNNGKSFDKELQDLATISLEMMFENYLNEIGWIASEIDEVLDTIINTEENVVLQLDLLRNRILKFELSLSISSFIIACGALVTGLLGMNLINHFETNQYVFWILTAILGTAMYTSWMSFRRFAKREKLF